MWRRGFCCQNQRSETSAIQFRKDKWVRRCLQLGYNLTFKSSPNRKASLGGFSNQEKFRRKTFCWLRPFVFSKVVCVQPTRNGCQDIWNSSDLALVVSFPWKLLALSNLNWNAQSTKNIGVEQWLFTYNLFLYFGKEIARFLKTSSWLAVFRWKSCQDLQQIRASKATCGSGDEMQRLQKICQGLDQATACPGFPKISKHKLVAALFLKRKENIISWIFEKWRHVLKKFYRKFLLLYSCGFQWRRNVNPLIF